LEAHLNIQEDFKEGSEDKASKPYPNFTA